MEVYTIKDMRLIKIICINRSYKQIIVWMCVGE